MQPTTIVNGKNYTFVKSLGHGRWGGASLVTDSAGRKYTLKTMQHAPEGDPQNKWNIKEADINQKLGRLCGFEQGVPTARGWKHDYLLLDYIDGVNATTFLKNQLEDDYSRSNPIQKIKANYLSGPAGRFSSGLVRNITLALRIIEAYERIMQKDVVQTDSKFDNIVVAETEQGLQVEVVDFGRAEATGGNRQLTQGGFNEVLDMLGSGDGYEVTTGILPPATFKKLIAELRLHDNQDGFVSYERNPTAQEIKTALKKLLTQAEPAPPQAHASNRQQTELLTCIRDGRQLGALRLLRRGATLDATMVAFFENEQYRQQNPKTVAALASHVQAYNANRLQR